MKILLTGAAGFIGMHATLRLLEDGHEVLGIDSLTDYYDPALKHARLSQLTPHAGFAFERIDVADGPALAGAFARFAPQRVLHLAAQVGVRYSIEAPLSYASANLMGFAQVLECCRRHGVEHLVYASSSSVYGGNRATPFSERHSVDHPVSLYAATKKANELMAHSYSHLFGLPTTGLRFFTVYGPWGRPDMAAYRFVHAIEQGQPIELYNAGQMVRDFTYVDDIVDATLRVLDRTPMPDPGFDALHPTPDRSHAPWRVFNVGNARPVPLLEFVAAIEAATGRRALRIERPMQPGDVPVTAADTTALAQWIGSRPDTPVADGVARFVDWYRRHHHAIGVRL